VIVTSIGGLQFPLQFVASPQAIHATLQWAVGSAKSPTKPVAKSPGLPRDESDGDDDSRYMPKG